MAKESLRDHCCAVNCPCACHVATSRFNQLQSQLFHSLYQLQALIGVGLACEWEECSASVRHDYFMVLDDYCQTVIQSLMTLDDASSGGFGHKL